MRYRTGVIGCGQIATGFGLSHKASRNSTHLGAYQLCRSTDVISVADRDPQMLGNCMKQWNISSGYRDYKEMLKKEPLDIVSICVPTENHFEIFKNCIEHGIKGIILEKPISYHPDQALEMVEIGQNTTVAVNYFRRWNESIVNLRSRICKGEFGSAELCTVHYNKGVFVNGSHFIDLMRWIFGEVLEVNLLRTVDDNKIDPSVDYSLTFPNNLIVHFLNHSPCSYNFSQVDILLAKQRITIGQRGRNLSFSPIEIDPNHGNFHVVGNPITIETEWKNCFLNVVENVVNVVTNGGDIACTLEDGLKAVQICHQLQLKRTV